MKLPPIRTGPEIKKHVSFSMKVNLKMTKGFFSSLEKPTNDNKRPDVCALILVHTVDHQQPGSWKRTWEHAWDRCGWRLNLYFSRVVIKIFHYYSNVLGKSVIQGLWYLNQGGGVLSRLYRESISCSLSIELVQIRWLFTFPIIIHKI